MRSIFAITTTFLLLLSTAAFAQHEADSDAVFEKYAQDVITGFQKLPNGFRTTINIKLEVQRTDSNTLQIKLNIPNAMCNKECTTESRNILKNDIMGKIPPLMTLIAAGLITEAKADANQLTYKTDNKGLYTFEFHKAGNNKDNQINEFLSDAFKAAFNTSDIAAINIKLVVEKQSNTVILIDKATTISGIKIPYRALSSLSSEESKETDKNGKAAIKLAKILIGLQRLSLAGIITLGDKDSSTIIELTCSFKGVAKIADKMITGDTKLFDAYFDLDDDDKNSFSSPFVETDDVKSETKTNDVKSEEGNK